MKYIGYTNNVKQQYKLPIYENIDMQSLKLPRVAKNVPSNIMIRLKPRIWDGLMPPNDKSNLKFDYETPDDNTWIINGETFHFNNIQKEEGDVGNIVEDLLDGYNYNIMTYGQAKTGKTRFLFCEHEGYIVTICKALFTKLSENYHQQPNGSNFKITLSAYELYAEVIYDLLVPVTSRKPLKLYHLNKNDETVLEINKNNYSIKHLKCINIKDLNHLLNELLELTSVYHESRKSHVFVKINIQQLNVDKDILKNSILQIVDFKDIGLTNDIGQEDMKKIKLGIDSFKLIIDRLGSNEKVHTHFKDSVFTKLLYSSLMDNYKNLFIICGSTYKNDLTRTLDSLKFASSLSKLETYIYHNKFGLNSKAKFDIYVNEIKLKEENYKLQIEFLRKKLETVMNIQQKHKEIDKNISQLKLENAKLTEQIKIVKQLSSDGSGNVQKDDESDKDTKIDNLAQSSSDVKSNSSRDMDRSNSDTQDAMQIILEKCEEIVKLQLCLDKERLANKNYQQELNELHDREIVLHDMNSKLLDQVNSQTRSLESVLSYNAMLKQEISKWTNLVENQNEKIQRLEQKLKKDDNLNNKDTLKNDTNNERGQSWSFPGTKTAFWKNTKHSHIESQDSITQSKSIPKLSNHVSEPKVLKHGLNLNSIRVVSNPISELSKEKIAE